MKKESIFSVLFLLMVQLPTAAFAQSLDPNTKDKIREITSETGHTNRDDQYARISGLSSDPVPYLNAILKDGGVRVYEQKAILDFIGRFRSDGAASSLEKIVSDETVHPSVRTAGLVSYAKNFGSKKNARVLQFLGGFANHPLLGKDSVLLVQKIQNGEITSVEKTPASGSKGKQGNFFIKTNP
ncbi:hypothetical protein EHO60_05050 [Leptospira fletcheri]|uniref:HEAT repeat domain-containing protein n=1 Tax=Leptospira fletcheri TaxID=2484981 RepID=A0A4R9GHR1_9LEPT|nr:hypothetical protein [Leptospira fletcheri]TGK11666.1 hypothetical protein EHO60_05050 [Leptospira fletcheri]